MDRYTDVGIVDNDKYENGSYSYRSQNVHPHRFSQEVVHGIDISANLKDVSIGPSVSKVLLTSVDDASQRCRIEKPPVATSTRDTALPGSVLTSVRAARAAWRYVARPCWRLCRKL